MPRPLFALTLIVGIVAVAPAAWAQAPQRHNVILFVPDGLRASSVMAATAPAMAALRGRGVDFRNSHALFPTFTMPNSAAMATGHGLGDTGVFSNTIYAGYPVAAAKGSVTPFLESDAVLGEVDRHFGGDYLDEEALLKLAREAGYATAAVGKIGPTLHFDHTERSGMKTVIVDDATGTPAGIPLAPWMADGIKAAGLPAVAPSRGENGKAGSATAPGTKAANTVQQGWFADVMTRVVLSHFKASGKPFAAVFWSRDPDGTQHNQGDSLQRLVPGINGPTSAAAIRNADDDLARIEKALADLGLAATTDIVVAADHGFSTISKESRTSAAARAGYADVPAGLLPAGFVAIDIADALGLPLWDPDEGGAAVARGAHPKAGNGLIGRDPKAPEIVVAANGGSDLVYLPRADRDLADRIVKALLSEDYASGLFVDERLGRPAGTLPHAAIGLAGAARTPLPSIVVNFRSFDTGCGQPVRCSASVADTVLQQGQGMHGSFSRADTANFMAAAGPDFKAGFVDDMPVSNADVGRTIAAIMGLNAAPRGRLTGRVLGEALPGGETGKVETAVRRSAPAAGGLVTTVDVQSANGVDYFDAAGFPGRTTGLRPQ